MTFFAPSDKPARPASEVIGRAETVLHALRSRGGAAAAELIAHGLAQMADAYGLARWIAAEGPEYTVVCAAGPAWTDRALAFRIRACQENGEITYVVRTPVHWKYPYSSAEQVLTSLECSDGSVVEDVVLFYAEAARLMTTGRTE